MINVNKSKRRSISKYRSNNIAVTVDSRQVKEDLGDIVPSIMTRELISIDYAGQTKTIDTTGICVL
jgi:hypothetical protein